MGRMQARDLSRRRVAMVMLTALPLLFYLSTASADGSFVLIVGGLGVGWSLAGAGLFIGLGSRQIGPRLALAGYRPWEMLTGQIGMLAILAIPLVLFFSAVILIGEDPVAPSDFVMGVALTALVSIPLGLFLGSVAAGELEGTLGLIGVLGVQMSLPATAGFASSLPLYGPITLVESSYGTTIDTVGAVPHALISAALLSGAAFVFWARRVRVAAPEVGV